MAITTALVLRHALGCKDSRRPFENCPHSSRGCGAIRRVSVCYRSAMSMLRAVKQFSVVAVSTSLASSLACDTCPTSRAPSIAAGVYGWSQEPVPRELGDDDCFAEERTLLVLRTVEVVDAPAHAQDEWDAQTSAESIDVNGWFEKALDDGAWLVCGTDDDQGVATCFGLDVSAGTRREVFFVGDGASPFIEIRDERTGARLATFEITL
jgi:hypothetical protein